MRPSVGIFRIRCRSSPFLFSLWSWIPGIVFVFSKASFWNPTFVYFLNCLPNLLRLSWFVLMDESESWTPLFGSSSLGREHGKIVFAYVHVWGTLFFFVFLSQPQAAGEPAPGTLTSLHACGKKAYSLESPITHMALKGRGLLGPSDTGRNGAGTILKECPKKCTILKKCMLFNIH